jgi:hypothetical protein
MKNRRLCAVSAAAARVIHRVGRVERLGCALGSVVCARGAFAKQERWTIATRASRHTRPLGGRPVTEPFRNAGFPRGPTAPEILCSRCREEPRLPQGWFLAGLTRPLSGRHGRLDEVYTLTGSGGCRRIPPSSSTSAPVESQPSEAQARASVLCLCLAGQSSHAGASREPGGRRGRGAGGRRRVPIAMPSFEGKAAVQRTWS